MDMMHLIGAEDVRSGGHAAQRAGETMRSAASQIEFALRQHEQFLDDWLMRFTQALSAIPGAQEEEHDRG